MDDHSSYTSFIFSKNFISSFSENFISYNYNIVSFDFLNNFYQESADIFIKLFWAKIINNSDHSLFFSIFLDQYYMSKIIILPIFNFFFRSLFNSSEFNLIYYYHPEYFYIFKNISNYYFINYFSSLYPSIYNLENKESFLLPISGFINIFIISFFLFIFINQYFFYFGSSNSDDSIIDHDYLIFNITIEAEEEIASIDDMIMSIVILFFIFFWFFWVYSVFSFSIFPNLSLTIYLFPFLYFIIFFIPIFLLYSYGSYFLTYLSGVGKSSKITVELLFDYISTSIFFLRLIVQNVRLIFMLFTYIELHELVLNFFFDKNNILGNENFIDSYDIFKNLFNLSDYSFLKTIPVFLIKWLYELFHTFFMVIFQFIAFFAMIFWLFLFLYTMFVEELQENYFYFKRSIKSKLKIKLS